MAEISSGQLAEFFTQLSRRSNLLTGRGFQGIINKLPLFNALGELAEGKLSTGELEKVVQRIYLEHFFPSLPPLFRYSAYGFSRLCLTVGDYGRQMREITGDVNYANPDLKEVLKRTRFSGYLDCPYIDLFEIKETVRRLDWTAGVLVSLGFWNSYLLGKMISSSIVRLVGIPKEKFLALPSLKKPGIQLVLFPCALEEGQWKKQQKMPDEIKQKLKEAGLGYEVRLATVWEALFLILSRWHISGDEDWPRDSFTVRANFATNPDEEPKPILLNFEENRRQVEIGFFDNSRTAFGNVSVMPLIEIATFGQGWYER